MKLTLNEVFMKFRFFTKPHSVPSAFCQNCA
jgi:hypothetical protein